MIANEEYFNFAAPPSASGPDPRHVRLGAAGFQYDFRKAAGGSKYQKKCDTGHKTGGITFDSLQVQQLPHTTVIFRFYGHQTRAPEPGEWWFTPHELSRICSSLGVGPEALVKDIDTGRSGLHASLALLSGWYSHDPNQLSLMEVATVRIPVKVYHGEGDVASSSVVEHDPVLREKNRNDPSKHPYQEQNKGLILRDPVTGRQTGKAPRQIFIPEAANYRNAFQIRLGLNTLTELPRQFVQARHQKLLFE